jgi:glycosyltransferase involved in cell wall biosynthesis
VLSVVVPCFNEEATVAKSIARLLAQPFVGEVIIVDDCSTDDTWAVIGHLDEPRIKMLRHEQNQGKGAALRTGFATATLPYVAIHDADLEYDPSDLGRLLEPLLSGEADVVFGSRFLTTEARRVLYFWHSVGNKALTLFSNMMTNLNLTDMETCYKVFRREVLERIRIEEDRFGVEPELTSKVAAMRIRVYEIGISYHGRSYADGKKIGWRDGARAVVAIVKHSTKARAAERRRNRRPSAFDVADTELAGSLENLDDAINYAGWVGAQMTPHVRGRVLEVGAGHGTFSGLLVDRADELVITDPSERAVKILNERYGDRSNVVVAAEDLEQAVARGPFDTIVMINVLEHIEDDEKALIKLREALAPGGSLCLYVPAFELLYSDFDRQIGHHRRYTTSILEQRIADAGLEQVDTYYFNAAGFPAWLVTARLLGRRPTDSRLVRIYDQAAVPVMRSVERRFRPPFGQSLVSISRRP